LNLLFSADSFGPASLSNCSRALISSGRTLKRFRK
jgi:hypothetical protein